MKPIHPTPDPLRPDVDNPTVEPGTGDPLRAGVGVVPSPVLVRVGSAKELGSCNRCSARSMVYEVELGNGRLSFRLCELCAVEVSDSLLRMVLR